MTDNNEEFMFEDISSSSLPKTKSSLKAITENYGGKVPALVFDGDTVFGAQFHPEKSGETGLKILKNFGGLMK